MLQKIKSELFSCIQEIYPKIEFSNNDIEVSCLYDEKGDFTSNLCLKYSKLLQEKLDSIEKKLSELISKLPSGILVTFDGTDHYRLTDEIYEQVCKATKLIPQRAIMGANFLNFRAHEIYTINGNKISDTFVEWNTEKNKCFAGFTVSGKNVGVNESITVSGEALSFLSTGIDTRVYYIKNF